jgi:hypothetical protein
MSSSRFTKIEDPPRSIRKVREFAPKVDSLDSGPPSVPCPAKQRASRLVVVVVVVVDIIVVVLLLAVVVVVSEFPAEAGTQPGKGLTRGSTNLATRHIG